MLRSFFFLFLFSFAVWADTARVGNNTALVIIDMQDYFATRNNVQSTPENARKIEELARRQVELIRYARERNIPVILVEYESYGETNSGLKNALKGYSNTRTFLKNTDGIFDPSNTHLSEISDYLRENEIGNLIISGANGGACVEQSISGALRNNYNVVAYDTAIADFNFSDFVYPYVNRYTSYLTPNCDSCTFSEANDPATMTLMLSRTARAASGADINDSDRSVPRTDVAPAGRRRTTTAPSSSTTRQ